MSVLSLKALEIAGGYVGISRENNPAQILKFDALFGLSGIDTSFCATGASYCFCKAYAVLHNVAFTADTSVAVFHHLLPELYKDVLLLDPRCHIMMQDAQKRGSWQAGLSGAKPGDLVMFNWHGDLTSPEHVGFVESVSPRNVQTIEFNTSDINNTNGGTVARKDRPELLVVGHISL